MRSDLRTVGDLGLVAVRPMEHWLLPRWLRPERNDQAREPRQLLDESRLQILHDPRLVADRESDTSLPR